jgi:uncharacterized repeat protein (TIGR01451 family)
LISTWKSPGTPANGIGMSAPVALPAGDGTYRISVFITTNDGRLYGVNALDGTGPSTDLRRGSCAADQSMGAPAVQLYSESNAAFRSAIDKSGQAGDSLVFVNTFDGCGDVTGNRVLAFYTSNFERVWEFNQDGGYQVGGFQTGCTVDLAKNRLYCASTVANGNTIFAFDTTFAGLRINPVWSGNVGSVPTGVRMGADGTHLYVANDAGTVYSLDVNGDGQGGLKEFWHLAIPNIPYGNLVIEDAVIGSRPQFPDRFFFETQRGYLCGVEEAGNAGKFLNCNPGTGITKFTITSLGVFLPGEDKMYVADGSATIGVFDASPDWMPWGEDAFGFTDDFFVNPNNPKDFVAFSTDSSVTGGIQDRLMAVDRQGTVARFVFPFVTGGFLYPYVSDVSISMTGPSTVDPGQAFEYVLKITNSGPSLATDVTVIDTVPTALSKIGSGTVSQGRFQINRSGNLPDQFVANLGDMAPNSTAVATISVTAPGVPATTVNSAFATANELDPNGNNNTASLTTVVLGADLKLTMTASPNPVVAGSNVTYLITVTNTGTDAAASVVVTDSLWAVYTPVSCSATAGGICSGGNNEQVTFNSLPAGAVAVITLVANVAPNIPDLTVIPNTASASFTKADPTPKDNSGSVNVTVLGRPSISVQISGKSAIGSTETLSLKLTNTGTGGAQNIVLSHAVPHTLAGSVPVTYTNPVLPLAIGNLAPGASTIINLTLIVPESVKKYSLVEGGMLQDSLGNHYSFSGSQVVFP